MAKYFLGSVGKAEAFRKNDDGTMSVAFVSKTLTDSGLNISTTKDDIRAGTSAPVQFSFCHDSTVEITLTDVLWKPEYLEAQLGARFETSTQDYITKELEFSDGVASYAGTVYKMPIPCGEDYIIWAAKKGSDEWTTATYSAEAHTFTLSDPSANGTYCVRFLGDVTGARQAEITSTIIPEELFLIITAPIFAGDACAASNGKVAGHITFEVPRFQLNGSQDFAMNMSSNQTMSLAGMALASESLECEATGNKMLRIIEVIDSRDYRDSVTELIVDEESAHVGQTPAIYGLLKDGSLMKIDNGQLTFTPALNGGKFAAQTYTIKLMKGETELLSESVTVSA